MKANSSGTPPDMGIRKPLTIIVATLPMILLTLAMLFGRGAADSPARTVSLVLAFLFISTIFVIMVRSGKTDKPRMVLYVTYAVAFVISFISTLIEERGSMALTQANMIEGATPFCHMVIPMTLIPAALTKTIIFPGTLTGVHTSIAGMFALWIGASLAIGRGFCSWTCFFGGLEEGFSRILRKTRIRSINPKWSYLPFGVLLAIVLGSAALLSPVYCEWLCPFKTVTEYVQVNSVKTALQAGIFLSLFAGLVIALPLFSKRRSQCSFLCPFGAFQSFTNKVSPFSITVDQEKCVGCRKCINVCPTYSMTEETLKQSTTRLGCVKCFRCVDACPKGAISLHVKGTPKSASPGRARMLFIYPAFIFLATMGGGMVADAIFRVIKLITTGSMI